jgi:hypothetical protein
MADIGTKNITKKVEKLFAADVNAVNNRIATCIKVEAERRGVIEDQIRYEFIAYFAITTKKLTWWENNSAQPPKELWNSIASFFFGKTVTDLFYTI